MTLLGPNNALPQEDMMDILEGVCFLASDACTSLVPNLIVRGGAMWILE
ncbi:hypothetical protein Tco_0479602, partial [Tanacetum coccineum]